MVRLAAALSAAVALTTPAFAGLADPVVRDCSTRAYGDLGRGWERRAVVAGPLAFVGMRAGYRRVPKSPAGRASPLKVLVVVDPAGVVTVTIAERSRQFASLAYDTKPLDGSDGRTAPLSAGVTGVRFEACRRPNAGAAAWNRGTQFPGYVLVGRPRCVHVEVRVAGRTSVLSRTLPFGASCS
jgi:hypothetical protein